MPQTNASHTSFETWVNDTEYLFWVNCYVTLIFSTDWIFSHGRKGVLKLLIMFKHGNKDSFTSGRYPGLFSFCAEIALYPFIMNGENRFVRSLPPSVIFPNIVKYLEQRFNRLDSSIIIPRCRTQAQRSHDFPQREEQTAHRFMGCQPEHQSLSASGCL